MAGTRMSYWTVSLPEFTVDSHYPRPAVGKHESESSLAVEMFAIAPPSLSFTFRLNKWDSVTASTAMIKAVAFLLKKLEGDIVLFFTASDHPILVRRNGQLLISNAVETWTPDRLEMLPAPYTIDDIDNIDDNQQATG
jgi:hypothetical protein